MLSKLHELAKNNTERLNWDDYFMTIASQRSPCSTLNVDFNRVIFLGDPYLIHDAPYLIHNTSHDGFLLISIN